MARYLNNYNTQKASKGKTSIFRSVVEVIAIFLFIIILTTVGFQYLIDQKLKKCFDEINATIETLENELSNHESKFPNERKFIELQEELKPIEKRNKQILDKLKIQINTLNLVRVTIKKYIDHINTLLSDYLKVKSYINGLSEWFKKNADESQLKEQISLVESYKRRFPNETKLVNEWEKSINKIKEQSKNHLTTSPEQTIDSCKKTIDSMDKLNKKILTKTKEKIETYYYKDLQEDILKFDECMYEPIREDDAEINKLLETVNTKLSEGLNLITVGGHTDDQPARGCIKKSGINNNRDLSYKRALYVSTKIEKYLKENNKRKKIDYIICTSAYGSDLPLDTEKTDNKEKQDEINKKNRRISITFSKQPIPEGSKHE